MRSFVGFLIALVPITSLANPFPKVPISDRILNAEEVENYWFNTLRRVPTASKPNSLHPAKQTQWEAAVRERRHQLQSILNGTYRDAAMLSALEHNVEAYRRLGDAANLAATRNELLTLREHQATLALLRTQRQSANRIASAAERAAKALEAAGRPTCDYN